MTCQTNKAEEFNHDGCRASPSPSSQNLVFRKNSKSKLKTSPSMSSSNSLSTIEILKLLTNNGMEDTDDDPLLFLDGDEMYNLSSSLSDSLGEGSPSKDVPTKNTFDYQAYSDKRVMTPLQERWNAITMLPAMFYGMYFVLGGCWLTPEYIDMARQSGNGQDFDILHEKSGDWTALFGGPHGFGVDTGCINIPWLPHLHALPPLPVLAGAIGIVVHSPFSFLYHWSYATKLHPSKRIEHWSRRLDHAFIHFASACMSYATSGRVDYFLMTAAYNLDCAYRQFEEKVRPRRNQIRITISILLYILPVLRRGYYNLFAQLVFIFTLSGWFFIAYPIGGWSHSMFHVVIAFLPHLIMVSACKLPISQPQIELAAHCAVLAEQS